MAPRRRARSSTDAEPKKRRRHTLAQDEPQGPDALNAVTAAYESSGKIFVLGSGDFGQLGLGPDVDQRLRPGVVELPDGEEAVQVTCGGMHTLCLCKSGAILTWGVNDEGALGRFTEGEAWNKSGLGKGEPGEPSVPGRVELPESAGQALEVSGGDSHSAVRTSDGAVYVWGTFRDGGGVMGFSEDKRIQVKPTLAWQPASEGRQVVQLASGADHIAALCRNGEVLTLGDGHQGQLGRVGTRFLPRGASRLQQYLRPAPMHLPFSSDKPASVACGSYSTFVVTRQGTVYACGLNQYSQLGVPGTASVFAPKVVKGLPAIESVAGGDHHTLFVTRDGKVMSVGRSTYGRLGRKDVSVTEDEAVSTPAEMPVTDLEGNAVTASVSSAAAGGAVSGVAFRDMCSVYVCGAGTNYQLGKGDDDSDSTLLAKIKRTKAYNEVLVTQLKFGGQHVAFLGIPAPPS